MNFFGKVICRDLGLLLHIPGLMALCSIIICLGWQEYYAIAPFLVCAVISLSLGQLLYRLCHSTVAPRLYHAMITVALAWGIIPLLASIPFLLIAYKLPEISIASPTILEFQKIDNAIFESFSGFTSAGLSVALHPSQLPHSLQWWRSFMQWIGGVGIIVLAISLLSPSTDAYQLYSAEGRNQKIGLTIKTTVRKIWGIYLLYTVAGIFLLKIAGMSWWEALNHGLTGISTGGFSIRDDSMGAYNPFIQLVTIIIMILGAISFTNHYQLIYRHRLSALWKDSQHCALWVLLVVGTGLLILSNYLQHGAFWGLRSVFQWTSALTTCGFGTTNLYTWNDSSKLLLSVAMVIGGAAGSTVGGIKLNRAVFLYQSIVWRLRRSTLKPHQIMRYQVVEKALSETEAFRQIESASVLALLWIGVLLIGIFVLYQGVLPIYSLSDVILEAASALGSVGLSVGITHPEMAKIGKFILIVFMWMGRLEIIPVLLLAMSVTQLLLKPIKR